MEYTIKDENGLEMLRVPRKKSVYDKLRYVLLFKPSKNGQAKTKVVIRENCGCIGGRFPIDCEDGKTRMVSMSGNFLVAGNIFNQRGESLGPNNLDYYVRPLNFDFNRSEFDVKFSEKELKEAMQG